MEAVYKACKNCGKEFKLYKTTDKYCSFVCHKAHAKPPKTKPRPEPHGRIHAKKLAKARDNFNCQLQFLLPRSLQHTQHKVGISSHHIIYLSQGGADSLDNLITLCALCHAIVHSDKATWQPKLLSLIEP